MNKEEALKAVREASISIACLTNFYEYFEDENNDLKNPKWVLKEEELLKRDIFHIQDVITKLENFIDPYIPEEKN
tara:strand:- start:222 stop:446 length:225 start_codon:yes stop_codon:yes gene_type:complete